MGKVLDGLVLARVTLGERGTAVVMTNLLPGLGLVRTSLFNDLTCLRTFTRLQLGVRLLVVDVVFRLPLDMATVSLLLDYILLTAVPVFLFVRPCAPASVLRIKWNMVVLVLEAK